MELEPRPRVPFVGWPRMWMRPTYGLVWVAESPAAVVSQSTFELATSAGVDALHDMLDEIIALGFLAANPGAVVIHDWRSIRTLAPGARETWSRRSNRPGKPFQTAATSYLAVSAGSLVRMAIQAGALAVQLSTGQQIIKIIEDPSIPILAHNIHAPPRDLYAKLTTASGRFRSST